MGFAPPRCGPCAEGARSTEYLRRRSLPLLELKNLHVALEDGTEIVKGVDLAVDTNEVHAIMGPNGSGKSTLSYAIMGHPAYVITEGRILLDGEDVTELGADERAQRCLLYTSDAADEEDSVDLGGRRIIKK